MLYIFDVEKELHPPIRSRFDVVDVVQEPTVELLHHHVVSLTRKAMNKKLLKVQKSRQLLLYIVRYKDIAYFTLFKLEICCFLKDEGSTAFLNEKEVAEKLQIESADVRRKFSNQAKDLQIFR